MLTSFVNSGSRGGAWTQLRNAGRGGDAGGAWAAGGRSPPLPLATCGVGQTRPLSRAAAPPPRAAPPEQTQLSAGLACRPRPQLPGGPPAPGGRRARGGGLAGHLRPRAGSARPLPPAPRFVMQMPAGGARPLPS